MKPTPVRSNTSQVQHLCGPKMSENQDPLDYPNDNVKSLLEKTVKDEGFEDYTIELNNGSAKGNNYLGVIFRAVVEGKQNGTKSKMNMIVKSAPNYDRSKVFIGMFFLREIYCYNEILPKLNDLQNEYKFDENEKFIYPKLLAANEKEFEETLIMEDITDGGYSMCNRQESLTIEHVQLVIIALARFHSLSFKMKEVDPEAFEEMCGNIFPGGEINDMFKTFTKMAIDRAVSNIAGVYKDRLIAFGETAADKLVDYILPELAGPHAVLCHGDCWTNNIMFKHKDDKPVAVNLLDWQMIKKTSPIVDIAYLLFSSTDEHLRGKHYNDLIELYYKTLSENLAKMDCDINKCFPRPVFEKHLKVFMPFGLIMGCITAPLFMSEEEDIPDMNTILEKDTFTEEDMVLKNSISQQKYEDRIRGIVKDMCDFNIIV